MSAKNIIRALLPSPRGRMTLQNYLQWRWWVCCIFASLGLLTAFVQKMVYRWCELSGDTIFKCCYIFLVVYLLLYISFLNAKRLHDIGRCGWWVCSPLYFLHKHFLGVDADGEPGRNKWGAHADEPTPPTDQAKPTPEEKKAVRHLYRRAAWDDEADAQVELAKRYFMGDGVTRCNTLALRWLSRALAQNCPAAQLLANRMKIQ